MSENHGPRNVSQPYMSMGRLLVIQPVLQTHHALHPRLGHVKGHAWGRSCGRHTWTLYQCHTHLWPTYWRLADWLSGVAAGRLELAAPEQLQPCRGCMSQAGRAHSSEQLASKALQGHR